MSARLQHIVWVSLLALLAIGVCYYSVMTGNHFVDSPHNGFFVKNALDLLEGRVLFRDSFNSYGFLSTLIHAAGMEIWGWRIVALLNVTLLFVVALGFGVYYLWSKVMPPWAAFLTAVLYFVYNYRIHLPWPNYYATFFTLCVGVLLMKWVEAAHRRRLLVAAGLMASLVFLARQTLAPPLVILVSVFLLFVPAANRRFGERMADLAIFLVSFLVVIVPFFVYLSLRSAVTDWWIQSFRLVPLWYSPFAQIGGGVLSQLISFEAVLFAELPVLTIIALAASVTICIQLVLGRMSPGDEALSLLAVISLAMLSQVYPNEGLWRRVLALSLGFGWLVYLPYRAFASRRFEELRPSFMGRSPVPMYVCAAISVLLVPKVGSVYEEARMAFNFESQPELYFQYVSEPEVFRGMWLPKEQASFYSAIYEEIVAFRSRHPNAPVITTNGDVLPLTFVRNNEGFSPMFTVYPSISWANITRNPAARMTERQIQLLLGQGRENHDFESDTANVLAYPDYWKDYASFVSSNAPLIINAGRPVPHYVQARTVVFKGTPEVADSQYYFWWSQFSDKPQTVIWKPES